MQDPIGVPWKLCPYLAPFLRYSDVLVENRQFEPTPPIFDAPVGVSPLIWNFDEIFGVSKLEFLVYRTALFA